MSVAKAALTEAVLDHFLTAGRLDESLRTTASAIGVSHSLLLYHFGSRDELLAAVHLACEQRQRIHLEKLRLETADPIEILRVMWSHLSQPEMWPTYRLGFSLGARLGDADGSLDDGRQQWLSSLTELTTALGLRDSGATDEAVLWLAACRGLLWELVTGADPGAIDRAAEQLFRHAAYPPPG